MSAKRSRRGFHHRDTEDTKFGREEIWVLMWEYAGKEVVSSNQESQFRIQKSSEPRTSNAELGTSL